MCMTRSVTPAESGFRLRRHPQEPQLNFKHSHLEKPRPLPMKLHVLVDVMRRRWLI